MNQKARHIGKRETDSSVRKRPRKLHTSEYENSCFTKKEIALYSKEDIIDYNQQCHPLHLGNEQYKQFPHKEEKGKGKEKKRECEREGKGEGKGEERREREREREEEGV